MQKNKKPKIIGPYTLAGTYYVDNTATLTTDDAAKTKSDSWRVTATLQSQGYTLTIGYWKTHAGSGPQSNMVSPLLPIWLGNPGGNSSILVNNASDAVRYFQMNGDASNGINKLYAQLLAAKLNIKNGADSSAIAGVITSADDFLATQNSKSWPSLTKAQKNQVLSSMTTLDQYNNGIIGPGHATK